MQTFPTYKQRNRYSCSISCLKIIAKYYNKVIYIENLEDKTEYPGLSIFEICSISERFGFRSRAYSLSMENINQIELPIILHWGNNHFVVLFKIKGQTFYISNPSSGKIEFYSLAEFKKHFIKSGVDKGNAISIKKGEDFKGKERNTKANVLAALEFLVDQLTPYKNRLFQLTMIMLLIALMYAAIPFITKSIIDVGIEGRDLNFIYIILIANVALVLFRNVGEWMRSSISLHLASRIKISIVSDYLKQIFDLPISTMERKMKGDIIQRSNDQERIQQFISTSLISVFMGLILLFIYGIILGVYDYRLFLIFAIGTLLYIFWVSIFFQIRKKMDIKFYQLKGKNQSLWIENLNSFEDIKLNNYSLIKRWDWEKIQMDLFKTGISLLNIDRTQQMGSDVINGLKDIGLTFYGAYLVIQGEITIGTLIAIQFIIGQLKKPVSEIINFIKQSQSAYISFLRLNEIRNSKLEQLEHPNLKNDFTGGRTIKFRNVSFKYPNGKAPVLNYLNFNIPEKKITAIVGASGSGKSTILSLIAKKYDNYIGDIIIGDKNIKNYDNNFLRKRTGYFLTSRKLYNTTIEKNITMSRDDVQNSKLLGKVLNWVNLANEISSNYSKNLDQKLLEGGEGLSQGQKDRLILARALYKRPTFLLLDEFTNSIDAISEKKINDLFQKGLKNQTTVICSHKYSTVKLADTILVIDKGRIVEYGELNDLIDAKGFFYKLFEFEILKEKGVIDE